MNDELMKKLESEFEAIWPIPASDRLYAGVAAELDERLTLADCILAALMGCGAVAACVIAAIILMGAIESQNMPPPNPGMQAAQMRALNEYRAMLLAGR